MPGLITHYICGESVLQSLPEDIANIIRNNRQLYNIGSQGPDIFFYYLPGLIRKATKTLGSDMHTGDFKKFVTALSEEIRALPEGEQRDSTISYLYGYFTHYALDYNTHPYIYYKTGQRKPEDKLKGLKYSVYHRNFETAIDVLMLKLTSGEKPSDKKLWQLIKTSKAQSIHVSEILGRAIKASYGVDITGRQVYSAMSYMSRLTRLLQSKNGKRKRLMEFVEGMTIKEKIVSSLIHLQEITNDIDFLNIKKSGWAKPWDKNEQSNEGFTELFDKAAKDSIKIIMAFDEFLRDEMSIDSFLIICGNYSFATGRDAKEKLTFHFHDIVYE